MTEHSPSHLIVDPNGKVTPQSPQDIAERLALGKWAASEFNKLLSTPGFDFFNAGFELRAQHGVPVEYTRAAYEGFSLLLREPNPPRFGVGMFGSVWVDLILAGKSVRLALDPSQAKAHGRWGILLMPLE